MKKKKVLYFVLFMLSVSSIFAQGNRYPFENKTYYVLGQMELTFQDDQFSLLNWYQEDNRQDIEPENFPPTDSGKYTIRTEYGYTVISVAFSLGNRDLILFYEGKQLAVYDTGYNILLWGQEYNYDGMGIYYYNTIKATSELTEELGGKEITYSASNLSNWELTTAWVEGVVGDGIGEELDVAVYNNHLVIVNGFFYPKDLSVYKKNNRVKDILVAGFDDEDRMIFNKEYTIEDSPNLQTIAFPERAGRIKIRILSVYKGNTYSDTAISGLFADGYLLEQLR